MRSLSLHDLAFVSNLTLGVPRDNFESYADGSPASGLNGGIGWTGAYIDRSNYLGLQALDRMDDYTDGAALNGLDGGMGWSDAYINDDTLYLGIQASDTMESYADAADVAGLNGGVGWTGAYGE